MSPNFRHVEVNIPTVNNVFTIFFQKNFHLMLLELWSEISKRLPVPDLKNLRLSSLPSRCKLPGKQVEDSVNPLVIERYLFLSIVQGVKTCSIL